MSSKLTWKLIEDSDGAAPNVEVMEHVPPCRNYELLENIFLEAEEDQPARLEPVCKHSPRELYPCSRQVVTTRRLESSSRSLNDCSSKQFRASCCVRARRVQAGMK